MKILSVECSAGPASAAIIEDGKVIASNFVNVKLTHSQTLLPAIENVLKISLTDIDDIDAFAVSTGPGSFTGVRIGISAIKGLAAPKNTPCIPVSTLAAMAENFVDQNTLVLSVMDARCNQFYNAFFEIENGIITRLNEDNAEIFENIEKELKKVSQNFKKHVIIVGDGAEVFFKKLSCTENIELAGDQRRYQNAVGVALNAQKVVANGGAVTPKELMPVYLRLPQAERELRIKNSQK